MASGTAGRVLANHGTLFIVRLRAVLKMAS
jgi:hypothetical protein